MTDRFEGRLSEYLDGELTPEEGALIERHLRECVTCAESLDELEAVVIRARELPRREPSHDLWAGIEARISGAEARISGTDEVRVSRVELPAHRRVSFSIPQLAAAAVTLASLSAGLAWLAGSRAPVADGGPTNGPVAAAAPSAASPDVRPVAVGAETIAPAEYYAASIQALESVLFNVDQPLPPATETRIRRALLIIDGAIEDARAALEEMPEDPYLRDHVTSTLRRKSEFLRGAVRMAAQS